MTGLGQVETHPATQWASSIAAFVRSFLHNVVVSLRVANLRNPSKQMRRHRQAKIVATLGPATSSLEAIRSLFVAGADVFRFNFSHGTHEAHERNYEYVRHIERETGRPIAVLADLQGPKLRVGQMAEPSTLVEGQRFILDRSREPGDSTRVPMSTLTAPTCPSSHFSLSTPGTADRGPCRASKPMYSRLSFASPKGKMLVRNTSLRQRIPVFVRYCSYRRLATCAPLETMNVSLKVKVSLVG